MPEPLDEQTTIAITVNGRPLRVPAGTVAAAAVARLGSVAVRRSVTGQARGPLCGMGICFECRLTVDGRPNVRSCQLVCTPGMKLETDVHTTQ